MRKGTDESGFAIALTLVLMALIAIVVVAYLVSTRIERSTATVHANRLRAKITADSGLTAAIHLLRDNTRYGNYITVMPAPVPTPSSIYTEVYRPADPSDRNHGVLADDFLRLDNAAGDILVSTAVPSASPPAAGPDARPTPEGIPTPLAASSPFTVTARNFLPTNSYDFNQLVTVGSTTGRLIQPSPSPVPPAYGQWVNIRNNATPPEVIGRYGFFIEDESMKVNVNVIGNNVGGSNMRVNDLSSPVPTATPASQIQEMDPSAILPTTANRAQADTTLVGLGSPGSRLLTRFSLGLLNEWNSTANAFPNYSHIATVQSRDDDTTARGWQRMNLNALAANLTTPARKKPVATRIANWIREAWTGPGPGPTPNATLQTSQLFGDDRLRQQIAANIVDYIAPAGAPTDMGDVVPSTGGTPIPVIGIEKMPYIHAIEIIFQASNTNPAPGNSVGPHTATIKMKFQCRFINLFGSNLLLTDQIGKITVKGVPAITKNGATLLDVSGQTFTINATDLKPYTPPTDFNVSAGVDGTSSASDSGARTFQTDWLVTQGVAYTVPAKGDARQRFTDGTLNVQVLGKNGERLDVIQVTLKIDKGTANALTGYYYGSSTAGGTYSSWGDFVEDAIPANGPTQIASISITYGNGLSGTADSVQFGDPRYRGATLATRMENEGRTDATVITSGWAFSDPAHPFAKTDRITSFIDQAEVSPRTHAFDWYDYDGDRPLAFIRNGPMINIGELGNVATCEYPWRSVYLQYPERPANSTEAGVSTDIPLRRSQSLDYVLVDLFRTQNVQPRVGALNINSQQQLGFQQRALGPLFLGVPVGTQSLSQTAPDSLDRIDDDPASPLVASVSNRRVTSSPAPFPDNNPVRPFFQSGELASVLSRLVNTSRGGVTTTSDSRGSCSTVSYGLLRNSAATATEKVSGKVNANIQRDMQVEQLFREVSNSITTRGNVFRVLYVGQALKSGIVQGEYLGEAFVERQAVFTPDGTNPDIVRTTDSTYRIIANRVVTE
jgi:hypothetical protein